ncbi:hypothetical protein ACH5RR_012874 [Cinchona calisaya]|uniref:GDSL esterase/lipase n=1 Tax=Cinchona calisaya TaxID=153742 RepID=A0ABD3AAL4_9GENT
MIFDVQPILGAPQVPCYFSFGDSLVDNGNNNNLLTTAKANYPPYGIDFPDGPTGRFTNGRNLADFIAQLLGFDNFIPPFATARGQDIIKGVNYGSGGAGIRDDTSRNLGDVISFNKQLLNHGKTISRIAFLLGRRNSSANYLNECIYTVVIGSNDYINNYFMPQFYPTSRTYNPDQYAAVLIQQYSQQLTTLYIYGARKIALFGLGAIGCAPAEINMFGTAACVDSINSAVQLFNDRLRPLVDYLNARLPGAKFIYLNASSIQSGDPATIATQQNCARLLRSRQVFGLNSELAFSGSSKGLTSQAVQGRSRLLVAILSSSRVLRYSILGLFYYLWIVGLGAIVDSFLLARASKGALELLKGVLSSSLSPEADLFFFLLDLAVVGIAGKQRLGSSIIMDKVRVEGVELGTDGKLIERGVGVGLEVKVSLFIFVKPVSELVRGA